MGDFYGTPTPIPTPIRDLLLSEFDIEMPKARATLERIPDKPDFAPHERSTKLGKLAPHLAQLAGFGMKILTTPEVDFANTTRPPMPENQQQMLEQFDSGAAATREALLAVSDTSWEEQWKLSFNGHVIFTGTRFLAYREMFLNHIVHHRAQLGVYLRLNEVPVPSIYGPSADEQGPMK
jgi:uncharacterized damage-inducible protein DinB